MFDEIPAGIQDLDANNRPIGGIVHGDILSEAVRRHFERSWPQTNVRGVDLWIIRNFHALSLLEVKGVDGHDHRAASVVFDDRHDLFDAVESPAPCPIILKVASGRHPPMLRRSPFSMGNRFNHLLLGSAPFPHLLPGMAGEHDMGHAHNKP